VESTERDLVGGYLASSSVSLATSVAAEEEVEELEEGRMI
jgi:hypothetical protein